MGGKQGGTTRATERQMRASLPLQEAMSPGPPIPQTHGATVGRSGSSARVCGQGGWSEVGEERGWGGVHLNRTHLPQGLLGNYREAPPVQLL